LKKQNPLIRRRKQERNPKIFMARSRNLEKDVENLNVDAYMWKTVY
jgi:hypothetical protein